MPMLLLRVAFVFMLPTLVHADLNEDFAVCPRTILQIGSDPRSPADQYCLGLSDAFVNHKWDRAGPRFQAAGCNHSNKDAIVSRCLGLFLHVVL